MSQGARRGGARPGLRVSAYWGVVVLDRTPQLYVWHTLPAASVSLALAEHRARFMRKRATGPETVVRLRGAAGGRSLLAPLRWTTFAVSVACQP
jgi:hypothetical protein